MLSIHIRVSCWHTPKHFYEQVQSFFRGWLCRRRWKQIVELYIRSPHAESMRKRNSIVFSMVECEEEYNRQLSCLVTCFLRPLRMAASSKKPPVTHEDVNSIFLNRSVRRAHVCAQFSVNTAPGISWMEIKWNKVFAHSTPKTKEKEKLWFTYRHCNSISLSAGHSFHLPFILVAASDTQRLQV